MALVTPDDVATRLMVELTDEQDDAVASIIDGIESQVQTILGRVLAPTVFEDERVLSDHRGFVRVRHWPMRSLTSAEGDNVGTLDVTDELFLLGVHPWGFQSPWTVNDNYTLTYSAGDDVPDIAAAILDWSVVEAARQVMERAPALAKLAVEGETLDFLPPLGRPQIMERLGRWRRITVR